MKRHPIRPWAVLFWLLAVTAGMKAGDIDPRCRAEHCFTVSDKARAIGGGVLEGLLYFGRRAGLWSV